MPDLRSLRLPRQDRCAIATGFASGDRPGPEMAAAAVEQALAKMGSRIAGSVLLLLTPHFGRNTQLAIAAAARTAHCVQVAGCTAAGVFTEADWSLNAPAAAALVLSDGAGLVAPQVDRSVLTLLAAGAAHRLDTTDAVSRFGLLSIDGEGELPARVWSHGRVASDGRCELSFANALTETRISRGLRVLSGTMTVTGSDGYDVFSVAGRPALATLLDGLPPSGAPEARPPFSQLFAALVNADCDPEEALGSGRYQLLPILGASHDEQSLTLALPLDVGNRIFWTLRQPAAAERDSRKAVAELASSMSAPDFALMFSCIGRGPYFFGTADQDLASLTERFPDLPVIGAYGAGEIAPRDGGCTLLSYSAVMTTVSCVRP